MLTQRYVRSCRSYVQKALVSFSACLTSHPRPAAVCVCRCSATARDPGATGQPRHRRRDANPNARLTYSLDGTPVEFRIAPNICAQLRRQRPAALTIFSRTVHLISMASTMAHPCFSTRGLYFSKGGDPTGRHFHSDTLRSLTGY